MDGDCVCIYGIVYIYMGLCMYICMCSMSKGVVSHHTPAVAPHCTKPKPNQPPLVTTYLTTYTYIYNRVAISIPLQRNNSVSLML